MAERELITPQPDSGPTVFGICFVTFAPFCSEIGPFECGVLSDVKDVVERVGSTARPIPAIANPLEARPCSAR